MYRIGKSTDIHQLVANRPLVIGGVKIPSPLGLQGHSDADILCHAIAEAILGALNLKDLGTHFSDQDEKNKNRCSLTILQEVVIMMEKKNYEINNVDCLYKVILCKVNDIVHSYRNNLDGCGYVICNGENILISENNVEKALEEIQKSISVLGDSV